VFFFFFFFFFFWCFLCFCVPRPTLFFLPLFFFSHNIVQLFPSSLKAAFWAARTGSPLFYKAFGYSTLFASETFFFRFPSLYQTPLPPLVHNCDRRKRNGTCGVLSLDFGSCSHTRRESRRQRPPAKFSLCSVLLRHPISWIPCLPSSSKWRLLAPPPPRRCFLPPLRSHYVEAITPFSRLQR